VEEVTVSALPDEVALVPLVVAVVVTAPSEAIELPAPLVVACLFFLLFLPLSLLPPRPPIPPLPPLRLLCPLRPLPPPPLLTPLLPIPTLRPIPPLPEEQEEQEAKSMAVTGKVKAVSTEVVAVVAKVEEL
jgi:hypothetical protein